MEGLLTKTPSAVEVVKIEGKGRGVIARDFIPKDHYICEYETSAVYPRSQMKKHEEEYTINGEGSYILEVQIDSKWMCFDATRRYDGIGRLLNHAPSQLVNCKPYNALFVRGKYRIAFITTKDVTAGEELLYDYGCGMQDEWVLPEPKVRTCLPIHNVQLANVPNNSCACIRVTTADEQVTEQQVVFTLPTCAGQPH